jgi:actin-related protein
MYFKVGPAKFRAPELLFRPDLIGEEFEGLHEVLIYAIQKSDMDLRKTLYSNIVLSGGSTLFKGKEKSCRRQFNSGIDLFHSFHRHCVA